MTFLRILLATLFSFSTQAWATSQSQQSVLTWKGTGTFVVAYDDSQSTPQTCSYVLVQVIENKDQLRLSTSYNCEDSEDQEFVPLTLERRGEKLFDGRTRVGRIHDQTIELELKNGEQVENYVLDFRAGNLKFTHESRLGMPGIGRLTADLAKVSD